MACDKPGRPFCPVCDEADGPELEVGDAEAVMGDRLNEAERLLWRCLDYVRMVGFIMPGGGANVRSSALADEVVAFLKGGVQ